MLSHPWGYLYVPMDEPMVRQVLIDVFGNFTHFNSFFNVLVHYYPTEIGPRQGPHSRYSWLCLMQTF